jgi:aspartyl-tRNA(Asn)/glutamyl-tRNA(Gln) amidotransferase subunit C
MALTAEQIASIAHLARLEINEAEVPAYQRSLSSILEFVSQLNGAKTGDVKPMAHPLPGLVQRMRGDEVTEKPARERYQANAPQVEAGLYIVPKVIE